MKVKSLMYVLCVCGSFISCQEKIEGDSETDTESDETSVVEENDLVEENTQDDDGDGVFYNDDCNDNNPRSTIVAEDADCDGILTADDCNDNDEFSTVLAEDPDCDGEIDLFFYLDSNGTTIKCPHADVGDTGVVNQTTYTKRDRESLRNLVVAQDWNSLETSCTSSVTNIGVFMGEDGGPNEDITNVNLNSWDTSEVTSMGGLFYDCYNFNGEISNWDTSNVKYMPYMFGYARSFNGDISNWNTSNVENMMEMFDGACSFCQDLRGWCVSQIPSMPIHFSTCAPDDCQYGYMPRWGTCP